MRESIEAFGSASRPLTDVKEEPQDKDEDYQMVDAIEEHRISEGNLNLGHLSRKSCRRWSFSRELTKRDR